MKDNFGDGPEVPPGFNKVLSQHNLSNFLNVLDKTAIKFIPVDTETSVILGRTVSWSAIGSGLGFFSTLKVPMPIETRIAAAIAGALIGAGAGYFTATHRIQIRSINPGGGRPFFYVSLEPC